MKREEQERYNKLVGLHFYTAIRQLPDMAFSYLDNKQMKKAGANRLRKCTAWVWETPDYYVLQSYNSFVACIEKESDTCYDNLRIVYGYTATSAQHIAKFKHDYGSGKWGCETTITAR